MLDQFLDLLKTHGFWLAFLWATIDTDFIFLILGALGHAGSIHLGSCLPAAMLGAVVHDTVLFLLVHRRADWVRSRPSYAIVANRVEAVSKKAGYWQLALCRPLYGTRYPTLIFWGLQKLSLFRFWLADLTGLIPWALLLTSLGYIFDDRLEALKHNVVLAQRLLLAAVVLGITVWVVISKVRKKSAQPTKSSHPGNPA